MDQVWLFLIACYSRLHAACHERLGINLRGLGWMLRRLQSHHIIHVAGLALYLEPSVASSYGVLLAGEWNEPETHAFLRSVNDAIPSKFTFIDVGANIGAMALDAARFSKNAVVIAVEPNPECARAIVESAGLNGFTHVRVVQAALTSKGSPVMFASNARQANASHLVQKTDDATLTASSRLVMGATLDALRDNVEGACVILIDVEGAELDVLRGGKQLIEELKPLIVFEYNAVSRKHFSLAEITSVLGPDYEIFRLNSKGRLDKELSRTWNCCAMPTKAVFRDILPLLLDARSTRQ